VAQGCARNLGVTLPAALAHTGPSRHAAEKLADASTPDEQNKMLKDFSDGPRNEACRQTREQGGAQAEVRISTLARLKSRARHGGNALVKRYRLATMPKKKQVGRSRLRLLKKVLKGGRASGKPLPMGKHPLSGYPWVTSAHRVTHAVKPSRQSKPIQD